MEATQEEETKQLIQAEDISMVTQKGEEASSLATDNPENIELKPLPTSNDEKTDLESESRGTRKTTYQSINVYAKPSTHIQEDAAGTPGTLRIVSEDVGGPGDFFDINVDLLWDRRDGYSAEKDAKAMKSFGLSVDELLTVRMLTDADLKVPQVELTRWGGQRLPLLEFPNGPQAVVEFFNALKEHLYVYLLNDLYRQGKIYAVEKIPRMRRIVPTLTTIDNNGDLGTSSPTSNGSSASGPGRRTRLRSRAGSARGERDSRMMLLEEFAKVTQLARNVGENLSLIFDERKRREEDERKEREWRARQRALDLFAEREVGDDNRRLPPFIKLDEPRGLAVNLETWKSLFDENGKFLDIVASKQAIFSGGLEPDVRPLAWPFLLKAYRWEASAEERSKKYNEFKEHYAVESKKWAEFNVQAESLESSFSEEEKRLKERAERLPKRECKFLQTKEQIAKDIIRTDRHMPAFNGDESTLSSLMSRILNIYASYNDEIGYCQGMSDILSPIVYVMGEEEEALAFWCFASLMKARQENFLVDQTGIKSQLTTLRQLIKAADSRIALFFERTDPDLYTCFRWVIVQFKREFPFEATAKLWEAFWTEQIGGEDFHLYVAVGLLQAHRQGILGLEIGAFDALLRYINDMSMRIDVDFALKHGEKCFRDLTSTKASHQRKRRSAVTG